MHIYRYNYEPHSEELVKFEIGCIFGCSINTDFIVTDYLINPNRSYFLNYRIDVLCSGSSVDQIVQWVSNSGMNYEAFKIEFIDVKSDVMEYRTRIDYCIEIANSIDGYGQMKNPTITFVVTYVDGIWYFGELIRNDRSYERLHGKVHTYSHSMSCELSRTVVNIAVGQENPTLIDPCCGIGTVIAEAYDLGYDIEGTELNWLVYDKAKENLEALDIPANIQRQDMHDINNQYDVSILDIPYGLMSKTSVELQTGLIAKCFDISDKLVLISNEEAEHLIEATKWNISNKIKIPKANYMFERYVYILNKEWAAN